VSGDKENDIMAPDVVQTDGKKPVRFVTAASLFDGHDAAINIIRRMLQATGAEVIHLGHNRSVEDIVRAAIEEDVHGIAVSSYQGGHMEFFKYMIDLLKERGATDISVYGGGGGVIVAEEIEELEEYGVVKIYTPEDGRKLGLQGIIDHMVDSSRQRKEDIGASLQPPTSPSPDDAYQVARIITRVVEAVETGGDFAGMIEAISVVDQARMDNAPVVGFTGTGGSGKSSLCDELIRRYINDFPEKRVAVLSIDPTRLKTGGALLGDRIRMNVLSHPHVFLRSLATRGSKSELPVGVPEAISVLKRSGYDLILLETSGIGQADMDVVEVSDLTVYVMTPEFGAPTQLEKIAMFDYADLIAVNKFEKQGAEDAYRDVVRQVRRARDIAFDTPSEEIPVFGTMASKFHDEGVNGLYLALVDTINARKGADLKSTLDQDPSVRKSVTTHIIPPERSRYLAEIADTVVGYHTRVSTEAETISKVAALHTSIRTITETLKPTTSVTPDGGSTSNEVCPDISASVTQMEEVAKVLGESVPSEAHTLLEKWEETREAYTGKDSFTYKVRTREFTEPLYRESLAGSRIPRVALPTFSDKGDLYRWLRLENIPGSFPYTAGSFPFKRSDEEPKRQFAGEGPPERTNRRFHYLSADDPAKRLSTAFDSVTLYGNDPDPRPDIYGKVGESGVSICSLADMKKLYSGFELCHPNTSVSMTINGPAPIMLANFFNTAIDQQYDRFREREGRDPTEEERQSVRKMVLENVRGTVQADILKEDQAQNTCIFSTEFALKMMGDIQEYFIQNGVRNYYSVSISGYHIAEAGANPITQLALTLANGFTYVEYYLSRGLPIDSFAPNLSFFFSNGMDPEYTVIGRVARRIWSIAMRDKYGGNDRSQKLKYHIQTSGRSLHQQEIAFNDIRTTLQALLALNDNCNSLHTNSYDEAITTPSEEAVRRAMAIQMVINREFGLAKNENQLQGSFVVQELTDLVEKAVLEEFRRIADRGGVLGAMETQYQRNKIQEESMLYEVRKHDGSYPIIGVNTYLNPNPDVLEPEVELTRTTEEERQQRLADLNAFQEQGAAERDSQLQRLQEAAVKGENIFAVLMDTVRVASLGQITTALYEVGGQYRRAM